MRADPFGPLIQSLSRRDTLSAEERRQIEGLSFSMRAFRRGEELVAEMSRPSVSCLVVEGLTARAAHVPAGKRQIAALHIPGDFVDLHCLLLKEMDHSIVAMSDSVAALVPHQQLLDLTIAQPHIGRLFWLSTLIDAAIQRAWITNLGRRSPAEHLAHLVCEMYLRLSVVGLAADNVVTLPVTQTELADIFGLSTVHVNRTLQELRATRLLSWKAGRVEIADFDALANFADFDPTYLNLIKQPR